MSETRQMAWRHWCGTLNDGAHDDDSICAGCRSTAQRNEVEVYVLADPDGPTIDTRLRALEQRVCELEQRNDCEDDYRREMMERNG